MRKSKSGSLDEVEVIVQMQYNLIDSHLATKHDIALVKHDIALVKLDIEMVKKDLKIWMGGFAVAGLGLLVILAKLGLLSPPA